MPAFRMTVVAYAVQALIATLMVEDMERRAAVSASRRALVEGATGVAEG